MTNPTRTRGFSLVEMIVSVGIFSVVMLIATSAYFSLISLDRRARATNQVVNNLSFSVDAMMRGIRTGTEFRCLNGGPDADGNSVSGSCTQYTYTDSVLPAGNNVVTYFLSGGGIYRNEGSLSSTLLSTASRLTDPSITVTSLIFYVRGAGTSDDAQPQTLITIKGTMPADSSGNLTSFAIEETVTQRLIDL